MKKSSISGMRLKSYDDLFGAPEAKDKIQELDISLLHEFKNHPFKVIDDAGMQLLQESISQKGVLIPIIVRKDDNGYEIVAGHRRVHAAKGAGLTTVPADVRDLTDDEAVIIMTDSNLQRETILPSERAFAYRMRMEALSHQGVKGCDSPTEVGKDSGTGGRQVQRYIRLTYLLPNLLDMVDQKRMTMETGVTLSFLPEDNQQMIAEVQSETGKVLNVEQAKKMKEYAASGELTKEKILLCMSDKTTSSRKVVIKSERIYRYFPKEYGTQQIEDIICELLDKWKEEQRGGE